MTPEQRRAAANIRSWRENSKKFVWDNFQVEPDHWQCDALDAFDDPEKQRISLQACAGPGKTAVLAWCGWKFLSCFGEEGHHPKGAAVSVTATNLADNLWPEFSKWQSRSPFLSHAFTWTKSRIFANDHPETWFMAARSFSKTANSEEQGRTLSGLHSKYVLGLIDESGDIPPAVGRAAEQALSTKPKFGKILQAGNPTSLEGMLHAAATILRDLWHVIRITGDPDDPKRSSRIDIDWAREQIKTFGRDNPWVMSFILGLFPPSSINALLGADEVNTAIMRHLPEHAYQNIQKRLGIDCARFGDDRTILYPRQGLAAFPCEEMRGADTHQIAGRAMLARRNWEHELDFIDDTGGWGAGVIDNLRMAGSSPVAVNASGSAIDPRYFNKRAECYFEMAKWVRRGASLPNDPGLVKELTAPTYYFQDGKLRLEEKAQIKKRLGFSPDKADSLSLTFSLPDMPAAFSREGMMLGRQSQQALHDWDPFR